MINYSNIWNTVYQEHWQKLKMLVTYMTFFYQFLHSCVLFFPQAIKDTLYKTFIQHKIENCFIPILRSVWKSINIVFGLSTTKMHQNGTESKRVLYMMVFRTENPPLRLHLPNIYYTGENIFSIHQKPCSSLWYTPVYSKHFPPNETSPVRIYSHTNHNSASASPCMVITPRCTLLLINSLEICLSSTEHTVWTCRAHHIL